MSNQPDNKKPHCPKNHRFRPVSFNEKTGEAVYACKCGIEWPRKAKFMCAVKGAE